MFEGIIPLLNQQVSLLHSSELACKKSACTALPDKLLIQLQEFGDFLVLLLNASAFLKHVFLQPLIVKNCSLDV